MGFEYVLFQIRKFSFMTKYTNEFAWKSAFNEKKVKQP